MPLAQPERNRLTRRLQIALAKPVAHFFNIQLTALCPSKTDFATHLREIRIEHANTFPVGFVFFDVSQMPLVRLVNVVSGLIFKDNVQ